MLVYIANTPQATQSPITSTHNPDTSKYSLQLSHFNHIFISSVSLLFLTNKQTKNNSEDYYGDLDLKSIRKSELLAGLANADSRGNAAIKKTKNKNE